MVRICRADGGQFIIAAKDLKDRMRFAKQLVGLFILVAQGSDLPDVIMT
jgi:hypothetical protein